MANTNFMIYRSPLLEIFQQEHMRDSFPEHFHDYYVIGCLLVGERFFCCSGRTYPLGSGQIIALNPGQIHTCQPMGKARCSWLAVHFPRRTGMKFGRFSELVFNNAPRADDLALYLLLKLTHNPSEAILGRLIDRLLNPVRESPADFKRGSCHFTDMRLVYQSFVEKGYGPVKLEEAAARVNMPKFTFSKKFKKYTGISPYRYLETIRLNRARKQISQGMEISQCAQELGFHDQSHLNRQFRDIFGFTPGILRSASLSSERRSHE